MSNIRNIGAPFTMVVNDILTDKNISNAAKGLYAYMRSKPDGWNFSTQRMANELMGHPNTIKKLIVELEEHGWLRRNRLSTGRMEYEMLIEKPEEVQHYTTQKPQHKIATVANSHGGDIVPLSNTDIKVIKSISNTDSNIYILPYRSAKTPLSRLRKFYSTLYRKKFNLEPRIFLNGKDGGVLKSLLKDYNEFQIAALMIEHFESTDSRLVDAAYPIPWISNRVNQYTTAINREIDFSNPGQIKDYVSQYMRGLTN